MPNSTPVYVVSYAGVQLPGYVQTDDRPLSFHNTQDRMFGRDGGRVTPTGVGLRDITLTFLIKSSLGTNNSGIDHLDNLMDQYRQAVATVSRPKGENDLVIHNTDRYYLATVESISLPLEAAQSRSLRYTVSFVAQPWSISTVAQVSSFTGNGITSVTGLENSRRTYPIFDIPTGVTAFTVTDGNGHTLQFLRGAFTGAIRVNTGSMTVIQTSNLANAISTMENLNFGLYYEPDVSGTLSLTITDFAGSGTVNVLVYQRYEL